MLPAVESHEKVEAAYEYEKCEGKACVSLHSQTRISIILIHPFGIWLWTTTEMQHLARAES